MPLVKRHYFLSSVFICIVESFYDNHTLEGPFHGNTTVTLYCPLLYKYNHSTYSVHVLYMWCVWVCNSTHWVYPKQVGLVENLRLSTEGGNIIHSDNTRDPSEKEEKDQEEEEIREANSHPNHNICTVSLIMTSNSMCTNVLMCRYVLTQQCHQLGISSIKHWMAGCLQPGCSPPGILKIFTYPVTPTDYSVYIHAYTCTQSTCSPEGNTLWDSTPNTGQDQRHGLGYPESGHKISTNVACLQCGGSIGDQRMKSSLTGFQCAAGMQ